MFSLSGSRLLLLSACSAFWGCGLFSSDKESQNNPLPPSVSVSSCGDVSDPWADSLVNLATQKATTSFEQMGQAFSDENLSLVRERVPAEADALLDQVLARYPAHCGAQFAKGVVILSHIVNVRELDTLVALMNETSSDEEDGYASSALFKLKAEEMPTLLFQSSQNLKSGDALTITRVQESVESSVLPVLDSVLAYMQNVMDQNGFAFRFAVDGRTYEVDRGEIGPALAALKLLKVYTVFFLAHELEFALDDRYDWIEDLPSISNMDQLSSRQKAALDQYVGLFNSNSLFSTVKTRWKEAYAGIPVLLDSAVGDLQSGLRYGIEESLLGGSQEYDLYVVGKGPDADVDPEDLKTVIDDLERIRKYLRGPVTIRYNKGLNELTVDLPRFFAIVNGYQDLLPYHRINAYETWNDVVYVDSTGYWTDRYYRGPFAFLDSEGKPTFGEALGWEIQKVVDEQGLSGLADKIIFPDPTFGGVFPGMTQKKLWATLERLESVQVRSEVCEEVTYGNGYGYYTYEECYWDRPGNPSDLDLLTYYLH